MLLWIQGLIIDIYRLPKEASDATIKDVTAEALDSFGKPDDGLDKIHTDFNKDKDALQFGPYSVPNSYHSFKLNVEVNEPNAQENKATVTIYNAGKPSTDSFVNLEVGENNIIIVVTAADGVTQNLRIIKVIREQMKLEIKSNNDSVKIEFDAENTNGGKLTEDGFIYDDIETQHYYFKADGTKNLKTEDFVNFVVVHDEISSDNVVKTVVTNEKGNEVVVTVTDGDQTRVIHFQLVDAQLSGGIGNMQIWIIGIIAIILLTAILISVNRQKYGRISNKRKA